MNIELLREELLQPLQLVIGVVERRLTFPILSHVLLTVEGDCLSITVTDLEVELIAYQSLSRSQENQRVTLPGRKLMDICRTLPEQSTISISMDKQQVILRSGKSRFSLSTLSAEDFPEFEGSANKSEFMIVKDELRYLLEHTYFAMAQEDVRYYLNGLFCKVEAGQITAVGSDGHRLACAECRGLQGALSETIQAIIPRKCVSELLRLVDESEDNLNVSVGESHIAFSCEQFSLTSKLIDGKYPDHRQLIPRKGNMVLVADKNELKQVLTRTSILSNEKIRGVRLELSINTLRVIATNPEQEEAEDEISIDYQDDTLVVGFNVGYILDVLSIIDSDKVKFTFADADGGVLIESLSDDSALYVVMPMRL